MQRLLRSIASIGSFRFNLKLSRAIAASNRHHTQTCAVRAACYSLQPLPPLVRTMGTQADQQGAAAARRCGCVWLSEPQAVHVHAHDSLVHGCHQLSSLLITRAPACCVSASHDPCRVLWHGQICWYPWLLHQQPGGEGGGAVCWLAISSVLQHW